MMTKVKGRKKTKWVLVKREGKLKRVKAGRLTKGQIAKIEEIQERGFFEKWVVNDGGLPCPVGKDKRPRPVHVAWVERGRLESMTVGTKGGSYIGWGF